MHNSSGVGSTAATPINAASAAAWQATLQRVADDIDLVVEDFLVELHGSSLYEDGLVEHADLRHTAHETFRYLLDQMMAKPMSAHQRGAAKRLGARRADQRVQLEDLMAAIRLDFIVLWRRMRTLMPVDQVPVLVDHTEILLTTIEYYIREVQLEFLAETARIARDARLATERHLARLLNTAQLSQPNIDHIAQGLGVDAEGRFEVVVVHENAVLDVQAALADQLATGQLLGYPYGSGYCIVQQTGTATGLAVLCERFAGGYREDVAGLAAVPQVVASLHRLLEFHPDLVGLTALDQLWPAAVADTLTELLPDFPHRYLAGLHELPRTDRADVLVAIESFLTTGSVKETAEVIGRHRNTVINRLRTFETATGLDVKVPRDAVLATLVLSNPAMQMHK